MSVGGAGTRVQQRYIENQSPSAHLLGLNFHPIHKARDHFMLLLAPAGCVHPRVDLQVSMCEQHVVVPCKICFTLANKLRERKPLHSHKHVVHPSLMLARGLEREHVAAQLLLQLLHHRANGW